MVVVAVRAFSLTKSGLWLDEGFSLRLSNPTESLSRIVAGLRGEHLSDRLQPLYFVVLYLWRHVLGSSEPALRALSLVFGSATVAILYLVARALLPRRAALWALAFMTVSAFAVSYSRDARPAALLMLMGSLQLLVYARLRNRRQLTMPDVVLFASVSGVAFFASVMAAFFAVSLAVADLSVFRERQRLRRLWPATALALLPGLAYYVLLASVLTAGEATAAATGTGWRNGVFMMYGFLVGTSFGPPLEELHGGATRPVLAAHAGELGLLVLVIAILTVALVMRFVWDLRDSDTRRVVLFLAVTFVLMSAFSLGVALVAGLTLLPRHTADAFLPMVLLLSIGTLPAANDRRDVWAARFGAAALVALLALNIYSLSHLWVGERYAGDDYRGVARYLAAERQPGERSLLLHGDPELLRYYGDTETVDATSSLMVRRGLGAQVAGMVPGASTVWLIVNLRVSTWKDPDVATVSDWMSPDYVFVGVRTFRYFTLYEFAAATAGPAFAPPVRRRGHSRLTESLPSHSAAPLFAQVRAGNAPITSTRMETLVHEVHPRFCSSAFPDALKALMWEHRLSYRQLAYKTRLSAGYLNHLTKGTRPAPADPVITVIATALMVRPEYFLEYRVRQVAGVLGQSTDLTDGLYDILLHHAPLSEDVRGLLEHPPNGNAPTEMSATG